ncbi:serine/threonine-protein kinase [Mycobacterium shigaense]|uniref:serine/threonine-protein kinase n=1 Tax=Mycobacterium shigaense TaxID=722731 RepID=UPI000E57325C|nr:serine/threonine-protein kinase [Mycobacterium shigaense]
MALASGATFAGYVVARRLGSGMTGDVYLVQDRRSARWAALKILAPAWSSDSEFRGRFHWETPLAANLRHPHVVEVHDRGEFEDRLWIAMNYVEGINAAQLMTDRFPAVSPLDEVLAILTAAADALDEAHHRGLLHRDVKPANIVLTGRGEGEQRILLTDFGIARGPDDATPGDPVGYTAPEQSAGAVIDGRADQYALAASAFHLLTGAQPRPGTDAAPPRLSDQRPELAGLDAVFSRALAADPADRFPSCRAFADAASERGGIALGDHGPGSASAAEYLTWPDLEDLADVRSAAKPAARQKEATGPVKRPAPKVVTPRPTDSTAGPAASGRQPGERRPASRRRRSPRRVVLTAVAVLLVAALFVVAFLAARRMDVKAVQAADATSGTPAPTPAAAPTSLDPPAQPAPLDGTYRLEVDRTKQTYNDIPDPQPPDVTSWWALRSSCTPSACSAAGVQMDDADRSRVKALDGQPVMLDFRDGSWVSRPTTGRFACVGLTGVPSKQVSTQVLTLRPQPSGELTGEMTLTVQSNACRQQGAVIRAPAVATRTGDAPPDMMLPDPVTISDTAAPSPHR